MADAPEPPPEFPDDADDPLGLGPPDFGGGRGEDDPDRPVLDGMHPPTQPQLVVCIHCGEEYDSWRIEWRVDDAGHGLWCCPEPGCDGAGFGVDIYPVDYDSEGYWYDPDGRELHCGGDDDDEFDDEDEDPDADPFTAYDPSDSFNEIDEDDIPF